MADSIAPAPVKEWVLTVCARDKDLEVRSRCSVNCRVCGRDGGSERLNQNQRGWAVQCAKGAARCLDDGLGFLGLLLFFPHLTGWLRVESCRIQA